MVKAKKEKKDYLKLKDLCELLDLTHRVIIYHHDGHVYALTRLTKNPKKRPGEEKA